MRRYLCLCAVCAPGCKKKKKQGAHPSYTKGHFHPGLDRHGALIPLSLHSFTWAGMFCPRCTVARGFPVQWQLQRLWVTPPQRQRRWHTSGHLATIRPASVHKSSYTVTRQYTALSNHQSLQSQRHQRQQQNLLCSVSSTLTRNQQRALIWKILYIQKEVFIYSNQVRRGRSADFICTVLGQ